MHLLDLNQPKCNTVIINTYGAQDISISTAGQQNIPLPVGDPLTVADWKLHRKDHQLLTLYRPQNPNATPITLEFSPAVNIGAEAWFKGRSPIMLDRSQLTADISQLHCSSTAITATIDAAAQVPAAPDPRVEELTQEIAVLRQALETQGRIADSGLAGAERIREQLAAEMSRIQPHLDALEAQNELERINLERARARVRELEADLQVMEDAIQVGSNPGYQSVPFVKLLNRARNAITNLQRGFALLVQGKELLMDKRGRAVVTSGTISADEDRIPDLPDNDTPLEDDDTVNDQYTDLYESDTGND